MNIIFIYIYRLLYILCRLRVVTIFSPIVKIMFITYFVNSTHAQDKVNWNTLN